MGAVLEMMRLKLTALATVVALLLSGCGNAPSTANLTEPAKMVIAKLTARFAKAGTRLDALDPVAAAALREVLEQDGQPIIMVSVPTRDYVNLMAPYGQNGAVKTWSSEQYQTVSLKDGILVATRGFGSDIMSSAAPTLAQIARGFGTTNRSYYYLDGADQPQRFDYTCTLVKAGSETVKILANSYNTRKIEERCSGKSGSFVNKYWFESSQKLRQSHQLFIPQAGMMQIQLVVDP